MRKVNLSNEEIKSYDESKLYRKVNLSNEEIKSYDESKLYNIKESKPIQ